MFAFLTSLGPIQAADPLRQQLQRPLLAWLLLHRSALHMYWRAVAHPPEVLSRLLCLRHASAHCHHRSCLQEGTVKLKRGFKVISQFIFSAYDKDFRNAVMNNRQYFKAQTK